MPTPGRCKGKYVRKMHYSRDWPEGSPYVTTRCGKKVLPWQATSNRRWITCKTCKLIFDIPVGELDGCD